jgi:hypothetical protein
VSAVCVLAVGVTLLGLWLGGNLSFAPKPAPTPASLSAQAPLAVLPNSLTFLTLGDWGRAGNAAQMAPVPAMGAWAEAIKPNFIFSVGDNF